MGFPGTGVWASEDLEKKKLTDTDWLFKGLDSFFWTVSGHWID